MKNIIFIAALLFSCNEIQTADGWQSGAVEQLTVHVDFEDAGIFTPQKLDYKFDFTQRYHGRTDLKKQDLINRIYFEGDQAAFTVKLAEDEKFSDLRVMTFDGRGLKDALKDFSKMSAADFENKYDGTLKKMERVDNPSEQVATGFTLVGTILERLEKNHLDEAMPAENPWKKNTITYLAWNGGKPLFIRIADFSVSLVW